MPSAVFLYRMKSVIGVTLLSYRPCSPPRWRFISSASIHSQSADPSLTNGCCALLSSVRTHRCTSREHARSGAAFGDSSLPNLGTASNALVHPLASHLQPHSCLSPLQIHARHSCVYAVKTPVHETDPSPQKDQIYTGEPLRPDARACIAPSNAARAWFVMNHESC